MCHRREPKPRPGKGEADEWAFAPSLLFSSEWTARRWNPYHFIVSVWSNHSHLALRCGGKRQCAVFVAKQHHRAAGCVGQSGGRARSKDYSEAARCGTHNVDPQRRPSKSLSNSVLTDLSEGQAQGGSCCQLSQGPNPPKGPATGKQTRADETEGQDKEPPRLTPAQQLSSTIPRGRQHRCGNGKSKYVSRQRP